MIRIHRGPEPEVLADRGRDQTAELVRRVQADPGAAIGLEFDSGLYAHESVKAQLKMDHHGKCAFCEAKITHVAYGDVEHLRPKKAVVQREGEPLQYPGYYWLAYTWTNLLLSCQLCNQRHKRNLFPLADLSKRAHGPGDDLQQESPMFVDPSHEDPEGHIGFRGEVVHGKSDRGEETWRALGLNRRELVQVRQVHLGRLMALRNALRSLRALPTGADVSQTIAEIEHEISAALAPQAEFSAMTRAALSP